MHIFNKDMDLWCMHFVCKNEHYYDHFIIIIIIIILLF